MTATKKTPDTITLENSKLWQLAMHIAAQVRPLVKALPYEEHYILGSPAIQNATSLTSDIAMAVGKGRDRSFEYRFARGHLFTLKGLLLASQELEFIRIPKSLLKDIADLQAELNVEIVKSEPKNSRVA